MSIPSSKPVTDALVAFITTVTARPVGESSSPTAVDPPFAVIDPLPSSDFWGAEYHESQSGSTLTYQITSVGVRRVDAEALADTVRHALLDRSESGAFVTAMPVTGLAVLDRELVSYGGVDSERGVYNVRDVFSIHVTRT